jgi:hypothetical protein
LIFIFPLPLPLSRASLIACAAWLLGASALVAAAPGCAPPHTGPSLASGARPVTGHPRYDAFFGELNELWRTVQAAAREASDARAALAHRVGLGDDVSSDVLGVRLRERTARLASDGLTLELEFSGIDAGEVELEPTADEAAAPKNAAGTAGTPTTQTGAAAPTATLRTPSREPERRELRLLEVIAQAALSGATLQTEMARAERHAHALQAQLPLLRSQVPQSFGESAQRDQVLAQLTEAESVLPEWAEQARAVAGAADTLISLLDEAANTTPRAPRRRPAREEVSRDATPRAGNAGDPNAPPRRPKAPGAEPAPPAPTPDRPRDFEP